MSSVKIFAACCLVVSVFILPINLFAGDDISFYSEQNLLDFYRYDKSQPFDAEMDTVGTAALSDVINVSFTSIHDERVPGKLWIPQWATADVKAPIIFWLHGYGGNKSYRRRGILGAGLAELRIHGHSMRNITAIGKIPIRPCTVSIWCRIDTPSRRRSSIIGARSIWSRNSRISTPRASGFSAAAWAESSVPCWPAWMSASKRA